MSVISFNTPIILEQPKLQRETVESIKIGESEDYKKEEISRENKTYESIEEKTEKETLAKWQKSLEKREEEIEVKEKELIEREKSLMNKEKKVKLIVKAMVEKDEQLKRKEAYLLSIIPEI